VGHKLRFQKCVAIKDTIKKRQKVAMQYPSGGAVLRLSSSAHYVLHLLLATSRSTLLTRAGRQLSSSSLENWVIQRTASTVNNREIREGLKFIECANIALSYLLLVALTKDHVDLFERSSEAPQT
jgi:hypothetical protein